VMDLNVTSIKLDMENINFLFLHEWVVKIECF
jgi:hypothetical protein